MLRGLREREREREREPSPSAGREQRIAPSNFSCVVRSAQIREVGIACVRSFFAWLHLFAGRLVRLTPERD